MSDRSQPPTTVAPRAQDATDAKAGRINTRALFAFVYATSISSVFFALGDIGGHAQGLTPELFVFAGVFFQLTSMTYAEGAALHPQRGGSPTFARYAFNELVGFVSAWAIVLDYILLIAVAALAVPSYLSVFWPQLDRGDVRVIGAIVVILLITADAVRGGGAQGLRRRVLISAFGLLVPVALIILCLVLVFHGGHLTSTVHLGTAPTVRDLGFAIPITAVTFTGIEAASSLAVDAKTGPRDQRRLIALASAAVVVVCVGIAVVGIAALPVLHGRSALGAHENAPVVAIAKALHPKGLGDVAMYVVGVSGALVLAAASAAGMLGLSRVGYSLATHRQIPNRIGRLSPWGTPVIIIGLAAVAAIGLVIGAKLDVLIDIYAFGALITFTVAHLSVIVMRFREPALERDYRVPLSVRVAGAQVPLPAVLGALMSFLGWVALVVFHPAARYVGLGWLVGGVLLYVGYRQFSGQPVLRRLVIPDRALSRAAKKAEFGSILVPVFGDQLDEAAVQVASVLAGEGEEDNPSGAATIEAIYIIAIPMRLSLDGPLPEEQLVAAHAALNRAKEVGEGYDEVEVATAVVRARRVGMGIVREAGRRGVEAIVLAAESADAKPGSQRSAKSVGELATYVIEKATCPVILTAPPSTGETSSDG